MKIKLDENLPLRLATSLEDLGHDVHTTYSEGLTGHADRDMWGAAQAESRFLIWTFEWNITRLESTISTPLRW